MKNEWPLLLLVVVLLIAVPALGYIALAEEVEWVIYQVKDWKSRNRF